MYKVGLTLIDGPNPDFERYILNVSKCLGRNPMALVDSSPRMHSEHAKQLVAFNALKDKPYKNAIECLKDSQAVQPFLNYTFLCVSHFEVEIESICLNTGLNFWTANTYSDAALFLVGGNLAVWRNAVSVGSRSETTRPLFNAVYTEFGRIGLADIWANYDKPAAKGGGFLIEGPK